MFVDDLDGDAVAGQGMRRQLDFAERAGAQGLVQHVQSDHARLLAVPRSRGMVVLVLASSMPVLFRAAVHRHAGRRGASYALVCRG